MSVDVANPEVAAGVVVVAVVVFGAGPDVDAPAPPRLNRGFGAAAVVVAAEVVLPPRPKRGAGAAVAGVADEVVAAPRLNRFDVAAVVAAGVDAEEAAALGVFPPRLGNKGFVGAGVVLVWAAVDAGVAEARPGNVKPPVFGASAVALAGAEGFAKILLEEDVVGVEENNDGLGCELVVCWLKILAGAAAGCDVCVCAGAGVEEVPLGKEKAAGAGAVDWAGLSSFLGCVKLKPAADVCWPLSAGF